MVSVNNWTWGRKKMLGHNSRKIPESLLREFEQAKPTNASEDKFQSDLIEDYERAIERGLRPSQAISIIMAFVSEEFLRLD
jgi:hypothetical protein